MGFVKITRVKAWDLTAVLGVAAVQACAAGSGKNKSVPFFCPLFLRINSSASVPELSQTTCQDIVGDGGEPSAASLDLAPNTLRIKGIFPKQLGPTWESLFGSKAQAMNVAPVLVKAPEHGRVQSYLDGRSWQYYPNPGYAGVDQATFRIDTAKGTYRVVVNLWVTNEYDENAEEPQCVKIFNLGTSASPFGSSVANVEAWQRNAELSALLAGANQSFAGFQNLAGSAVGQTKVDAASVQIMLDNSAAGHGWYVDPTPLDNSDDYLPTSNPNVWQAKAGSDAAGKMDLLSVLLHEYGHALGLEHSGESGDFMAATLQPGQRRLPSAEELQLMSELVAQLKGGTSTGDSSPTNPAVPSLPLGALLLGRLALGRRPEDAVFDGSQALFAAHPTLQGGSLQNLQDWAIQGNVSLASGGGATLQEGLASQTRLNQVFTINERDRFLSFTLAGTALDDVNGGPDDAFEVALLEANTGRSLTGALSLGHTDALLNLQANGAETAAANVTRVTNTDGTFGVASEAAAGCYP